ncbi:MAG: hypothetical protein ACYCZF_08980 [Anaerolineae bacterium]
MDDSELIARFCRVKLDFNSHDPLEELNYASLPLCVIDTVYSIGARYASTELTVKRFCEFAQIPRLAEDIDEREGQYSIQDILGLYTRLGAQDMAERVFQNRQRTSTRNGILKAEAVQRFCLVLNEFRVNTLHDAHKIIGNELFETRIKTIPGHSSGISLRYFYILLGSQDYVKPDRMVMRFIESATDKRYSVDECQRVLVQVSRLLAVEYPGLTPSKLDHLIWVYQRNIPQKGMSAVEQRA